MEVGKINQTLVSYPMLWPHVSTSTLISILYSLDIINTFHFLIYFLPLKEQHILGSLTFKIKYIYIFISHNIYYSQGYIFIFSPYELKIKIKSLIKCKLDWKIGVYNYIPHRIKTRVDNFFLLASFKHTNCAYGVSVISSSGFIFFFSMQIWGDFLIGFAKPI